MYHFEKHCGNAIMLTINQLQNLKNAELKMFPSRKIYFVQHTSNRKPGPNLNTIDEDCHELNFQTVIIYPTLFCYPS